MLLKKHPIIYAKRPISAKNTIKTMTPPKKLQAVVSFDDDAEFVLEVESVGLASFPPQLRQYIALRLFIVSHLVHFINIYYTLKLFISNNSRYYTIKRE